MNSQLWAQKILDRVRVHWPEAIGDAQGSEDMSMVVHVHLVDTLVLELRSPTDEYIPWTVAPMLKNGDEYLPIPGNRPYGIGPKFDAELDDVADRFYEEIRFWWIEYETLATRA